MTTSLYRLSRYLLIVAGLLPFVWVTGILWLAIRAKNHLGYWPQPAHPDPQFLPFQSHITYLWYVFDCLKWSLVLVPVVYIVYRYILRTKITRRPLKAYCWGWVLILALVFIPNINVVAWFID